MRRIEKAIIGAFGGLSAVCVKFLGQDYDSIVKNISNLTDEQILSYKVGYLILTPILMFLGGFIAWSSDEEKRMKLVALAVAAPALITTYAGGQKNPDVDVGSVGFFITNAYAEETSEKINYPPIKTDSKKTTIETVKDGVRAFFGYNKQPKKYWVIVGSFKQIDKARKYAEDINTAAADLNAWVGVKVPPNEYYPVIVGSYSYLSEARKLKDKALNLNMIDSAYLSRGAKR